MDIGHYSVGFEVLTAVIMGNTVSWVVTICSSERTRNSGCLLSALQYSPEDCTLQDTTSHKVVVVTTVLEMPV
jgi:hypothetical protein